ncbi:hypothetical protein I4U30_22060 [Enterobacter asburiae]|uniref:hypothetical protein n=1 Tax=Enterobacter asburiae TaxID=61645 RepID=UPI00192B1B62|nr:hypothetical protein [Enterobacter asburiae]MBL5840956.1 hypothetical protein [Enterobacter asburiae]
MTEQEHRVKRAQELRLGIENTLFLGAAFNFWEDRVKVADMVNELHRMAIEPREDNAKS